MDDVTVNLLVDGKEAGILCVSEERWNSILDVIGREVSEEEAAEAA